MVDRNAAKPPSFGASSYYFGSNIPGKPRRYLLNSGGRPKFFEEVAKVVQSDYAAFRLSRASPAWCPGLTRRGAHLWPALVRGREARYSLKMLR
jgi:hypothetical protein